MKVRGYAAPAADAPLAPWEFERRSPGQKDVRIQIEYCGICHSDIHFARNEWQFTSYPCVPGHEIVGRVVEVGSAVTRHREGDRVGVGCFVDSCRTCGSCKEGLENYCESGPRMTYGSMEADGTTPTYGGYATQIVVSEDFVVKVPANLDPAGTAPLLCAGITTYSPLRHLGVSKGTRVAVLGLGGLGHMGVKLAASFGAEVTVLSHSPSKAVDAQRLGAHEFVLTNTAESLAKQAGRFDVILDTVSAEHDVNAYINCLKRDGTLMMVGASPTPFHVAGFGLIFGRKRFMGSLVGGLPETQEMLDHCGKHGITSDIEQIDPHQINEAYDRAVRGQVKYRFVIDCSKF
jgi:alcohol dehydrogenase (NADP+)